MHGSIVFVLPAPPPAASLFQAGASQMWKKYGDDKTNVTAKVIPEIKLAETATEQVGSYPFHFPLPCLEVIKPKIQLI